MNRTTRTRAAVVAGVAAVQLVLVGVAVAPQLSARTGDTYHFRVQPLDPIDPTRGAYVTLDYPDLIDPSRDTSDYRGESGDVYVTLQESGDVWVGTQWLDARPDEGPYLSCRSDGWSLDCGIDSYFTAQDRAARLEDELRDGGIAEVKIDGRGNAAVVDVRGE